ncbi:hypothetical protein GOBAR_DD04497 [Gossypium barbadense]|nr:hypothetical protein GOBAR_DD04497 [Gossypium barbadense]
MALKKNGFIPSSAPEELKKVLVAVASVWGDTIEDMEEFHKVLVRVYGKGVEVFFNRDDEIRTFECMSELGQGPRLLGRFSDGRIEEFIHARTLSVADLRDPEISSLIAAKLREFNNLDMPGPKNVLLWERLRTWLSQAKRFCSPSTAKEFGLDGLEEEISILEKELTQGYQEIGFCHNDLQYGNIMMDEETRVITLISNRVWANMYGVEIPYSSFHPKYKLSNLCKAANNHLSTLTRRPNISLSLHQTFPPLFPEILTLIHPTTSFPFHLHGFLNLLSAQTKKLRTFFSNSPQSLLSAPLPTKNSDSPPESRVNRHHQSCILLIDPTCQQESTPLVEINNYC